MRFDQRIAGRHRMRQHVMSRVADSVVSAADANGDGSQIILIRYNNRATKFRHN